MHDALKTYNENAPSALQAELFETSPDWFELFIGGRPITEGDVEHIEKRLRQIIRENGWQW